MSQSIYHWSVTLHVAAAIVWIGAMWFIGLVLAPELRRLDDSGFRIELYHRLGMRLRPIGWICIALLVLTGLYNLGYRGLSWARFWSPGFLDSRFGLLLTLKISAVLAMILLSALHDFVWGPKLTSLPAGGAAREKLRRRVAWIGRINGLLAVIVVILATRLFR